MRYDLSNRITPENMSKAAAFIIQHTKDNHYPPSVREIGTHIGCHSSSTAQKLVTRMLEKGYIQMAPGKARTLRISESGKKLAKEFA